MTTKNKKQYIADPDLPDGSYFLFPREFVGSLKNEDVNSSICSLATLSGNAVKVYLLFLAMRNFTQNGKQVWPSYDYIKDHTGIGSKKTISNAIMELVNDGWIEDVSRNGFSSYNKYLINTKANVNNDLIEKIQNDRKNISEKTKVSKAKNKQKKLQNEDVCTLENENQHTKNEPHIIQKMNLQHTKSEPHNIQNLYDMDIQKVNSNENKRTENNLNENNLTENKDKEINPATACAVDLTDSFLTSDNKDDEIWGEPNKILPEEERKIISDDKWEELKKEQKNLTKSLSLETKTNDLNPETKLQIEFLDHFNKTKFDSKEKKRVIEYLEEKAEEFGKVKVKEIMAEATKEKTINAAIEVIEELVRDIEYPF